MYSLRVTVVVLLSIAALMTEFDQGAALNCRVCSSKSAEANKDDCLNSPKKVEPTECVRTSSTPGSTPSTPGSTPSTPESTASTPGSTPSTSESTPSPPATTPPTAATTPPTPATTPPTPATTPPTPATTPPTPATTSPTPATTPPTAATTPPTAATTPPTAATTPPTAATTPPTPATTPPTPADGPAKPELANGGDDEPLGNGKVEALQIFSKFKRSVPESRADEPEFQCYKLVYKDGETNHVDRGCAEVTNTTCDNLKKDKTDAECYFCTKDGCNASSNIVLGIMSTIIPAVLAILAL